MQALNVKPVSSSSLDSKLHLVNEIYAPALNQKSAKAKLQEANIVSLQKSRNIRRVLEAYSDCV